MKRKTKRRKKTTPSRRPPGKKQLNALIDARVAQRFREHCRKNHIGRDAKLEDLVEFFLASIEDGDKHLFVALNDRVAHRFRTYRAAARRPNHEDILNDAVDNFIDAELNDPRLKEIFDALISSVN
jgi:hypothetical protein